MWRTGPKGEWFVIVEGRTVHGESLSAYVDSVIATDKQSDAEHEMVSRERTKTAQGLPAELLEYTISWAGTPMTVTALIYLHDNRIGFRTAYGVPSSRYRDMKGSIAHAFSTFNVAPTPTATPTPTPTPTAAPTPTPARTPAPTPTSMPTPAPEVSPQGCVSDPAPQFTAHITDLSKIHSIVPPTVLSGNKIKGRSYLHINIDQSGQAYEVPVYAPVDSILTHITLYGESGREQHQLSFQVSCEVSYGFDHLGRLAGNIAALATTTLDTGVRTSLPLKAGDLIGYTGAAVAGNWDFVFANSSKSIDVANLERYENTGNLGDLVYADCPYDYFADDLRAEYYALFSVPLDRNDSCLVTHDRAGTIGGAWFKEPFVLGVSHRYLPGWGIVVGISEDDQYRVNNGQTSLRSSPGEPTYVDPRSVTSEHCYAALVTPSGPAARHVYLKLLSDTELGVAFGEGGCPSSCPRSTRSTTVRTLVFVDDANSVPLDWRRRHRSIAPGPTQCQHQINF